MSFEVFAGHIHLQLLGQTNIHCIQQNVTKIHISKSAPSNGVERHGTEGNVANVAAGMLRMLRMLRYVWILWLKLKGKDLETMTGLNSLGRITVRRLPRPKPKRNKKFEPWNRGTWLLGFNVPGLQPGCFTKPIPLISVLGFDSPKKPGHAEVLLAHAQTKQNQIR